MINIIFSLTYNFLLNSKKYAIIKLSTKGGNFMKKFKSLFFSLFLILSIALFGAEKTIYVGAPKAPPVLPVLRMMETNALGKDYKIDIKVWNSPEILIAMVQGKEADFFCISCNSGFKAV